MARNDAFLTRAASTRVVEPREKRQEETRRAQVALQPAAEVVLEQIKKEQEALGQKLLDIINPETSDDQLRARLEAIRMHQDFLSTLQTNMTNILRHNNSGRKQ